MMLKPYDSTIAYITLIVIISSTLLACASSAPQEVTSNTTPTSSQTDTSSGSSSQGKSRQVEGSCTAPLTSVPVNTRLVQVYFTCNNDFQAVPRYVAVSDNPQEVAEATLNELVAGPTEAERIAGFSSFFSSDTANVINSVTITDGEVVVDVSKGIRNIPNASTSNGLRTIVSQLRSTLFQFPNIKVIDIRMDGSCDAFWGWLESNCQSITRS